MSSVFGFDFGTTNSLISFIAGNKAICVLEDGLPFPSVVSYQGDRKIVGRKAKEMLAEANATVIGNTVRSPKTLLGHGLVNVDGVRRNPRDIVADVVSWVRQQAIASDHPGDYDTAVVTIPIDMNGARRAELREAFRIAGMSVQQFVHEPLAALYGHLRSQPEFPRNLREFDGELILVFDWGGGTLDLTLCRIVDGLLVQVRNDGCSEVGGDLIDTAVRTHVTSQVFKARPELASCGIHPGGREKLLANTERAKIALSHQQIYPVFVSGHFTVASGDPDLHYDLPRGELEAVCEPFVEQAIQRIHRLLESASVSASSVALALCTGGMVNMPLIRSRLLEYFGPHRLRVSDHSATIIAEGAAWIAHDERSLSLAKNIELRVSVNSFMPILYSGTKMPREGEVTPPTSFDMYCTDPRDGHAKFQLCAPLRPGLQVIETDDRAALATITVDVHPEAQPFFERLRFDAKIDENLILTASAFSTMRKDHRETQIHNLEFGLSIDTQAPSASGGSSRPLLPSGLPRKRGGISLRPNIAATTDRALIPGDLLSTLPRGRYEPNPFDRDGSFGVATERQHSERLYYQPCAICGRMINDPLCRCASGASAKPDNAARP